MGTLIDYITKESFELSWPHRVHGQYRNWEKYREKSIWRVRTHEPIKFEARYQQLKRRPKIFIYKNGNETRFVRVLKRHQNSWGDVIIRFEVLDNFTMAEYIDDNRTWIDREQKNYKNLHQKEIIRS